MTSHSCRFQLTMKTPQTSKLSKYQIVAELVLVIFIKAAKARYSVTILISPDIFSVLTSKAREGGWQGFSLILEILLTSLVILESPNTTSTLMIYSLSECRNGNSIKVRPWLPGCPGQCLPLPLPGAQFTDVLFLTNIKLFIWNGPTFCEMSVDTMN